MVRFGKNQACLIAPGFPAIMLVNAESEGIWLSEVAGEANSEIMLPSNIPFDQAIQMVEKSAQANLDQALTFLARKLKEPWQAGKGNTGYSGA